MHLEKQLAKTTRGTNLEHLEGSKNPTNVQGAKRKAIFCKMRFM